jgi:hypothetical protein
MAQLNYSPPPLFRAGTNEKGTFPRRRKEASPFEYTSAIPRGVVMKLEKLAGREPILRLIQAVLG